MTDTRAKSLCPLTGTLETTILFVDESYLCKKSERNFDRAHFKNSKFLPGCMYVCLRVRVCVCVLCACVRVCVCRQKFSSVLQPAVRVNFI